MKTGYKKESTWMTLVNSKINRMDFHYLSLTLNFGKCP